MSTKWMKLLVGAGISASILSLNGCGGDDDATAAPATVTFGVTPVKGPFSSVSAIRAYGVKTGGALSAIGAGLAGQSGNTYRVSVPLAAVKDYDNIILSMDGQFSGDVKSDGTTDTTTKPITGFMVPVSTTQINADTSKSVSQSLATTIESGLVSHLAANLALKDLGALDTSGTAPTVKTTNMVAASFNTRLGTNQDIISQQLGVASFSANTRKAAEGLLSSRILKAFGSNAATSFTTFFTGFTKELAAATNPTIALTSTGFVSALTSGEFTNVSNALGAQGVTTSATLQNSTTNPVALEFKQASLKVRLTNIPTADTRVGFEYPTTISVTYGTGTTAYTDTMKYVRDMADGLFYEIGDTTANDNNHTVYSRLGSKFTTDTVDIVSVGTNANIATTNIHSVMVQMGNRSFTIANSGSPLVSSTSGHYDFAGDHLVSSARFMLSTPTNYDGAQPNVDSSYGIWFTTNSSFESTAVTGLSTDSFYLHYYLNDGTKTTYMSDYRRDTRGNFRAPSAIGLKGMDLVHTENAVSGPTPAVLTSGFAAWLTGWDLPGDINQFNPTYNQAFALAKIDLASGKTTESVSLTSVATSDRLTATFQMSGTTVTVKAPKLQTLDAQSSSIMVQNSSGQLVSADPGLRHGMYAVVIHNGTYTGAQFISVNKAGEVFSHGSPAATTSALTRITGTKLGTVDSFSFSLDASNISTSSSFSGMMNGQACSRFASNFSQQSGQYNFNLDGKCQPYSATTTEASMGAAVLSTGTNVVAAIHKLSPLNYEHVTSVGTLVSARSGTPLTASTVAMLEGSYTDFFSRGTASFILGTPTDKEISNESQGFWVIPEPAGTASTAITTRVTNPSEGETGYVYVVVCNSSRCYTVNEGILRTQGPLRRYGYSQRGMDLINNHQVRPTLLPTDLNTGSHKVQVVWDPFMDNSQSYRDGIKGLVIGEGAIASGATSGTVQLMNTLPMPTATVTF